MFPIVHEDISVAKTIDKSVYLSDSLFEEMKEKIFSNSWQFITSKSSVESPGDIYPFVFLEDYINEPLLISNDKENIIHCLSNVCTHRGNLLATEPCKSLHGIFCKYHGRKFQLDGKFSFMPEFKEVRNFPCEDDNLTSVPIAEWGNLIFIKIAGNADFAASMAPMMNRINWLPLEKFVHRPELDKDYHIDANWALYCENYLEGFHIPFVHEGLNAAIDYGSYETIVDGRVVLQIGYSDDVSSCFDLPESSIDYGKNIAAYYFWVYPNMMFNFYPWGLSINVVKPITVNKTKVSFYTYLYDESKYNFGAGSDLDKVEMEDEEIVQNVQKGIRSRFYSNGRYSVKRETGTHHFHRLLYQSLSQL